ncbi:MAG: hypothetical protein A2X86_10170 [Bdellovibrionales bacterium GWA2_49_15]|nr:MAG: hypothetical protein A2X86_10170 [Bdellovibrionales bacterium GWA2_49_15]HAZ13750.1 hypothetical protein [Bdellovibrionales bacterium]
MQTKILTLIISLFLSLVVHAEMTDEEAKWAKENFPKYEGEFLAKLKATEKRKHYYLYMLAGKSLYAHQAYEYAEQYFLRALEAPINEKSENKARVHMYLLMISYKEKDQSKNSKYLKSARAYYKTHSDLMDNDVKNILNFYEFWATAKQTETMPLPEGPATGLHLKAQQHNFYALFKRGEYDKALQMLDKNKVLRSDTVDTMVEYDLLQLLVKGRKGVDGLLCTPTLEKYPQSYDYAIITCDLLRGYLKDGTLAKDKVAKLEKYFTEFDGDMSFIVKVLGKL